MLNEVSMAGRELTTLRTGCVIMELDCATLALTQIQIQVYVIGLVVRGTQQCTVISREVSHCCKTLTDRNNSQERMSQ